MINDLLLCGVYIDWDKISRDSYVRRIPALEGVEEIASGIRSHFLWARTAAENPRCWKPSP